MNMKKVMRMMRMKVRITVTIWKLCCSEDDICEINFSTSVNIGAVRANQVDPKLHAKQKWWSF